jgi:LemA protein
MVWVLVIVGLLLAFVIIAYNSLVGLRVRSDSAWADIDVQLKRRYDLIPNLVETVKGYAAHERTTLERVIDARSRAMSAQRPGEKAQAEGMLTEALKSLFALAEAYPQLRAVENFTQLQGQLGALEEQIQQARRYYNAVVRDLNTRIRQFPTNLVANVFGFTPREFFEVAAAAEREAPKVRFETGA